MEVPETPQLPGGLQTEETGVEELLGLSTDNQAEASTSRTEEKKPAVEHTAEGEEPPQEPEEPQYPSILDQPEYQTDEEDLKRFYQEAERRVERTLTGEEAQGIQYRLDQEQYPPLHNPVPERLGKGPPGLIRRYYMEERRLGTFLSRALREAVQDDFVNDILKYNSTTGKYDPKPMSSTVEEPVSAATALLDPVSVRRTAVPSYAAGSSNTSGPIGLFGTDPTPGASITTALGRFVGRRNTPPPIATIF